MTVLLINLASTTSFSVNIGGTVGTAASAGATTTATAAGPRTEWHLTPPDADPTKIHEKHIALNGQLLRLQGTGDATRMPPFATMGKRADGSTPLVVGPASVVFVQTAAPAAVCSGARKGGGAAAQ